MVPLRNDIKSCTKHLLHPYEHCLEGCRKSLGCRRWDHGELDLDPRKHAHAQPGAWTTKLCAMERSKDKGQGHSIVEFKTGGSWRKQMNTGRRKSFLGNLFLRCVPGKRNKFKESLRTEFFVGYGLLVCSLVLSLFFCK